MAKGTLGQVIQRAISDAAFRNRLRTDPGGALSGFDLTPAERAALQSGDASKLASFGVDQRMSKAFAMGEAAAGVTKLVGTDVSMGGAIIDGGSPLGTNAILDEAGGSVRNADVDDAAGSVRSSVRDDGGPFDSGSVDDATGTTHNAVRDDGGPFDSGSVDGGTSAGREGTAFVTADEAGNDVSAAALAASDSGATSAFITADEAGNDVSASSLAASDSNATSAFITADEAGNNVTGNAATVAGSDSNATDAFLTADEMGNNVVAAGRAPDPDTALTQNDALTDGTATANPEGYEQPDPNAG